MAYEFMETAMQGIPEYNGNHSTLEPFIEQVEFFARKLPVGESQKTLVNIIILSWWDAPENNLKRFVLAHGMRLE